MLKSFHHVQRSRFFTSKLHSFEESIFVSKIDMKQQFLEGLNSASSCVTRSYAQVVSQGIKKNAVDIINMLVGIWVLTVNDTGGLPVLTKIGLTV